VVLVMGPRLLAEDLCVLPPQLRHGHASQLAHHLVDVQLHASPPFSSPLRATPSGRGGADSSRRVGEESSRFCKTGMSARTSGSRRTPRANMLAISSNRSRGSMSAGSAGSDPQYGRSDITHSL